MRNKQLNLQQQQTLFTAYIRDPLHRPMPSGVKPERMSMYAELIFNNIESFLSNNFPVIRKIHTTPQWLQLVRDFFVQHASKTPYFAEIPEEFLSYLQAERNNPEDYPFLLELAHLEWVEMALAIAQDELIANIHTENLLNQPIRLSPLALSFAYQYPVQQISPDFLPTSPPEQPTFLVVYRNPADEVKFMLTNAITYQLLALIKAQPRLVASAYFSR